MLYIRQWRVGLRANSLRRCEETDEFPSRTQRTARNNKQITHNLTKKQQQTKANNTTVSGTSHAKRYADEMPFCDMCFNKCWHAEFKWFNNIIPYLSLSNWSTQRRARAYGIQGSERPVVVCRQTTTRLFEANGDVRTAFAFGWYRPFLAFGCIVPCVVAASIIIGFATFNLNVIY